MWIAHVGLFKTRGNTTAFHMKSVGFACNAEIRKDGLWEVIRTAKAIWLILPVVIRLSQRLSHACLSISDYTVKLRTAH